MSISKLLILALFVYRSSFAVASAETPISTVQEIDLGQMVISSEKGATFEIDVPKDLFSLFIQVEGQRRLNYFFEKIENPQGDIILGQPRAGLSITEQDRKQFNFVDFRMSENPSPGPVVSEGFGFLIPNRDNIKLTPGRWKFWLKLVDSDILDHTVQVRTFIKKIEEPIDKTTIGYLDLNLYLSGAAGWTVENYKEDPNFQLFMSSLVKFLKTAGVIPRIRYVEDASIPSEIKYFNMPSIQEEFIKSANFKTQSSGINIFFSSVTHTSIRGIAWGLPGVVSKGHVRSGILTSVPQAERLPFMDEHNRTIIFNSIAATTAHEIGHYLGLFHVCEKGNSVVDDGLDDTKCVLHSNIMMPEGNIAPFSWQQRMVLFRNPHVDLYQK